MQRMTIDILNKIILESGLILVKINNISRTSKLVVKDIDGYYYYTNYNTLKAKEKPSRFYKNNPYTIQNINLWCELENKPFELVSDKYERSDKKLRWKCLKDSCNEIFNASLNDVLRGHGCGVCDGRQVGLSNCLATKNPELAREWHPTLNGDLTPYDVPANSRKKVWWKCSEGHEFKSYIYSRNTGNGCAKCAHQEASNEYNLLVIFPEICNEWNYKRNIKSPENYLPHSEKKVWWKCIDCGKEWENTIANRTRGSGCPVCGGSSGERAIGLYLKNKNYIFNKEYDKFSNLVSDKGNPLRFDFAIFKDKRKTQLRMLIEYDGEQHFRWVKGFQTKQEFEILKYHDKLKNEYCEENNIKLLRIPYYDYKNIETILEKELY